MNRVMLIYPPGKLYQRGEDRAQCNIDDSATATIHACNDLGYAAAILRNNGYEVFLKDYQTEHKTRNVVMNDVREFKPDAVFVSITNATIYDDIEFINAIKECYDCRVILKGAIFFDADRDTLNRLKLDNVDVMIGGESNFVILPLIEYLLKGSGKPEDIPGIIYRENGELKKTAFNCWDADLDSLPFPARDLMNNALYQRPDTGEPMATIQTSIGCPSSCIYCLTPIVSGRRVRFRSVENVFAEIEECYYKRGIKSFFFKADTFTINEDWAIELCDRIINSPLYGNISFTVNSRTNTLSQVLCTKLKLAGCFMLAIGFESGSDETLKKIKKGACLKDSLNAVRL
ncbi:MAG: B12-binding domain-containing radical SAM protein, partial [Eubacterium sp.]|nr:B12-binding domain-containing radical SAM protein [Eubacterium sp.]